MIQAIFIYEFPENWSRIWTDPYYWWMDYYYYQPHEDDHPWFEHHERGLNRTVHLNRAPTMDCYW